MNVVNITFADFNVIVWLILRRFTLQKKKSNIRNTEDEAILSSNYKMAYNYNT